MKGSSNILPSGQNQEQDQLNRRLVHKMAVAKVCSGGESLLRKEDILREIGTGMDDDDDKNETMNNISSDGSEVALVMDLSDQ